MKPRNPPASGGSRVALGLRAHSGWAVVVAISDAPAAQVILRRRVELADRAIRGSAQPYHAVEGRPLEDARAFLRRCADATHGMAETAVREAARDIAAGGHQIAGACVLLSSGRATPDLAATLASHPLIHTAEGHFYRDALWKACEAAGLTVTGVKERDLPDLAVSTLKLSMGELIRRASALGAAIGPPWRQDEKLCAIAAWVMLAGK